MKLKMMAMVPVLVFAGAARADEGALIQKLKGAKFSLLDAVAYAEKTSGPATSAKFELDDEGQNLVFSVYTAPQGIETSPESTDLTEVAGAATELPIQGAAEVFTDKEHIARASVHLALRQLSRWTLTEVIQKALRREPGMAFSVENPTVRRHRAVADVSVLTPCGEVRVVTVNLQSGDCTEE
ncbi:MAG TPA: hypothetical protein VL588_02125 [Bdellovibrionota bacterium]|nr:hypothetical protein [Bdellovibrionota bacterium]